MVLLGKLCWRGIASSRLLTNSVVEDFDRLVPLFTRKIGVHFLPPPVLRSGKEYMNAETLSGFAKQRGGYWTAFTADLGNGPGSMALIRKELMDRSPRRLRPMATNQCVVGHFDEVGVESHDLPSEHLGCAQVAVARIIIERVV